MDRENILKILLEIENGRLSSEEGLKSFSHMLALDLECAVIDTGRSLRNGLSEVVFGEGKSCDQIKKIVDAVKSKGMNLFGTRVDSQKGERLKNDYPEINYDEQSRTFMFVHKPIASLDGNVVICTAGTADIPVAREAARTCQFFGVEPVIFFDVGVAGLHRLLNKSEAIRKSDVIIVVAGMEGALPSVVAGLFPQPVVAVPTSVGYGTNLNGITTLHAMLSGCAEGVVVTNIDNGFGAACCAIRILNRFSKKNR